MRGDASRAAILARIATSVESVMLEFPPPRATLPPGPTALPASPLTSVAAPLSLVPPTPTDPEYPPRIVQCLWLDAPVAEASTGRARREPEPAWVDGASALARIAWQDVVLDPLAPDKGTWLDRCVHVVHRGVFWRILKVQSMGPSFRSPHSLSVWLTGVNKM